MIQKFLLELRLSPAGAHKFPHSLKLHIFPGKLLFQGFLPEIFPPFFWGCPEIPVQVGQRPYRLLHLGKVPHLALAAPAGAVPILLEKGGEWTIH